MDRLSFVFEVMIYVGIGLPLLNVILGVISSVIGGASAGGDAEVGMEADMELDLDAVSADVEIGDLGLEADIVDIAELGEVAELGDLADGMGETPTAHVRTSAPVRFNIYCLCLAMVVMGAVGVFAIGRFSGLALTLALVAGLAAALAAYVLLYRLVIRRLQKNDAKAMSMNDLMYQHAIVSFRITQDSPGRVEARDAVGAIISYRAEMDKDICKVARIEEQEEVIITAVNKQENVCYVTLADHKLL